MLTETALSDSRQWEILSQEEVDDLKKQIQSLTQRVDQTRATLAIQSKYRDAAISMAKLYSPTGPKRRSLLGNRGSGSDNAREAEIERQTCEKRCEELASELFSLEKRLIEPQMRLLQHTAGILQLTHKASKKADPPTAGPPVNGIPGSPESLYTYSNSRASPEPSAEDTYLDGAGLYLPFDQMDGQPGQPTKNTIEIPLKSPIRKETKELREEGERLREESNRLQLENEQLATSNDSLSFELEALQRENDEQTQIIVETERRLEDLNSRLREVIVRFNPAKNSSYKIPPSGKLEPGDLLGSQLKYLDDGLVAVQEEQELSSSSNAKECEKVATTAAASLAQAEKRIEVFNQQVRDVLRTVNPDTPPPPQSSGSDMDAQLDWLQSNLETIKSEVARATDISTSSSADKLKVDQADAVLLGLWDIIQSGYAELQRQKEERKKSRIQMGLSENDEDMSGDESPMSPNETYSLQAFSTKVQWLYAQATNLREQKSVLKRQIKQQRELNSKSDSEKELQIRKQGDDLRDAQQKLAEALVDVETARKTSVANESVAAAAAETQLKERNARIASLESSSKDLETKLAGVAAEIAGLTMQLQEAAEAQKTAEAKAEQAAKDTKEKDDELDRLNGMVVELKTEVTIAKAELDGAYGSRAQRAADVAQRTKSKENTELQGQIEKLKQELGSTLKEFEDLTKDTIKAEREKLELEGRLDDALASKAATESESRAVLQKLEAEIASLKEERDAERLKVSPTSGGGTTRAGASMLSEQFRATMKEERKKFQEEIRVRHLVSFFLWIFPHPGEIKLTRMPQAEQAQRRKLEDEIRVLRRAAGPGKSPLSPGGR